MSGPSILFFFRSCALQQNTYSFFPSSRFAISYLLLFDEQVPIEMTVLTHIPPLFVLVCRGVVQYP
jgi:hypothetical protein